MAKTGSITKPGGDIIEYSFNFNSITFCVILPETNLIVSFVIFSFLPIPAIIILFAGILLLVGITEIFPNSPLISLIDCFTASEILEFTLFNPNILSEFSKTNPHNASVFFFNGLELSTFIFTEKLEF